MVGDGAGLAVEGTLAGDDREVTVRIPPAARKVLRVRTVAGSLEVVSSGHHTGISIGLGG